MTNFSAVGLAPCAIGEALSTLGELRDHSVDGIQDRIVPVLVFRIEQMHRPLADDLPHRPFAAEQPCVVERRIDGERRRRQRRHDAADEQHPEFLDEAITDRARRGASCPAFVDEVAVLRART